MLDYSFDIESKRFDKNKQKDRLLELVSAEIERRALKTKDLREIIPTIDAKTVSRIRQGMRSAASIETLEVLAFGLGINQPRGTAA